LRLKIFKKLRTASFKSKFTGSNKKVYRAVLFLQNPLYSSLSELIQKITLFQ